MSNSNAFALLKAYRENPSEVHYYYRWFLEQCLSILRRTGKRNPRILDVGCSCGVFMRCLKDLGYGNVQGIEINPQAAEAGSNELGVPIISSPVESLPDSEKFDLILAFALLEHVQDPKALLGMLKNRLEKGGSVFFIVPNFSSLLRSVMGKKWLWYMPPLHLHHFTIQSMQKMIVARGFKILKLTTMNTGTYLFLVYCFLFGSSKVQEASSGSSISIKWMKRLDTLVRIFLSPLIFLCKYLDKEAHIVGLITNEDA